MRVEIWTDIICPWCGLGHHYLKQALERFEHCSQVEVVHRSFQLDRDAPMGEIKPVRQMLIEQKGLSEEQFLAITSRVETMAKQAALSPYIVKDNQVGNTAWAHELAAWATELGQGAQLWSALYQAYFGEARSIFDIDSLVELAAEQGLNAVQAREILTSRKYANQVREDDALARRLGASGVPFFVVDQRYAVGGAQPVEVLLEVLSTAWRESAGGASSGGASGASSGESCSGPDGCAIA